MGMTSQVKRAIDQMKEAGFDRSEFAVNVERIYEGSRGNRYYSYGDAKIYIKANRTRLYRLIPNIVAVGLGVRMVQFQDGRWWTWITTDYETEGKVEKVSYFGSDDEQTVVRYTTINGNRTRKSGPYKFDNDDVEGEDE